MREEMCKNCRQPVLIQIMKNTGLCSENCRKEWDGEDQAPELI